MARPPYPDALHHTGILAALAAFDPHVAGTPPLGLDRPDSDLDILCHAPDPLPFAAAIWTAFADRDGFSMRQWTGPDRPVVARFFAAGWPVEVFGQALPVEDQVGWRHFRVEQRLLALGGAALRAAVMRHRAAGAKTEPAFAATLGLRGDPYQAVLRLEHHPDTALAALLAAAGF